MNQEELDHALEENIKAGFIELTGEKDPKTGAAIFRMTAEGRAALRAMEGG